MGYLKAVAPPKQNKKIDMATIKTTVVDSPEKMHVWSKPV